MKNSPHSNFKDLADFIITLRIFNILEENPSASERFITKKTGLATGLVHSFMKKIIEKGWVKAKQVSPKRWLYFLTPTGFIEKSRISLQYFSRTLYTYSATQSVIQAELLTYLKSEIRKILVIGDNDIGEIAVLSIKANNNFTLSGVVGNSNSGGVIGETILSPDSITKIKYDSVWVCDREFWESSEFNRPKNIRVFDIVELVASSQALNGSMLNPESNQK